MLSSTTTPSLSAVAFEFGVYAVALFVLVRLWRTRRNEIPWMLVAMVFAGALEVSDIRTTHSYYYARFLIMIGSAPNWFPLAIAVAWGLVLHTTMTAAARLFPSAPGVAPRARARGVTSIPPPSPRPRALCEAYHAGIGAVWLKPAVAAVLGVAVDLVLDPVVANARVVSFLGEVCDERYLPHASAKGLGFWVWCVPAHDQTVLWGIPYANFYAWGVVVLGFSTVAHVLRDVAHLPRFARGDGLLASSALALLTGLCAFCVVDVALQLYTPFVLAGVPQWLLLALVFGPGVFLILRAGALRVPDAISVTTFIFPVTALAFCLGAYLLCGVMLHAGVEFSVYIALATLACVLAYVWVLVGRTPGLLRGRRVPLPPRAELLSSGPARVSVAELDGIAALADPVLRNYLITQRYHDLSVELGRAIAGPNANWCTFATWASSTAGESIREQEVPKLVLEILQGEQRLHALLPRIRGALGEQPGSRPAPDVFELARDTLARVRRQVAGGNKKVFAELAPLFARFLQCIDGRGELDRTQLARMVDGLRPGPSEQGGQQLLREAFSAYGEALAEPDRQQRAQHMLLANCLVGLHEQIRLQPNIAAAIDAPVDVLDHAGDGVLAALGSHLPPALRHDLDLLLGPSGELALRVARAVWQRIATASAMHLCLPQGAQIPLGENVELSLGEAFPAELCTIELPALRALLARYGAEHETPGVAGARDWAELTQRMRFILDLFRTTQQEAALYEQPFSAELRAEIETRIARADAPAAIPAAVPAE